LTEYLFGEEIVPVCCPALLQGKTQIEPAELESMPLLHQSARPDAWRAWFEVAGLSNVNAMGGARYELFSMLVEAAKVGLGVALVPRFFVLNEIASGDLVIPCPYVLRNQRSYYLVYPKTRSDRHRFRFFVNGCANRRPGIARIVRQAALSREPGCPGE